MNRLERARAKRARRRGDLPPADARAFEIADGIQRMRTAKCKPCEGTGAIDPAPADAARGKSRCPFCSLKLVGQIRRLSTGEFYQTQRDGSDRRVVVPVAKEVSNAVPA